ncbi:MAG: AraC family transcriptional regulator [Roseivirga sp.]|nr:AraC family transcriptional regulator [Roseivirga sp.]
MNWIDQILSFSVALGALMSGLIWFQKKDSQRRNRFLALLIFLISLQIAKDVVSFEWHPAVYLGLQGTCLFLGPTIYLYVLAMLGLDTGTVYQVIKRYMFGVVYLLVVSTLVLSLPDSPQIHRYINPPLAVTVAYTMMFAQLYHVLWYFQRSLNRIKLHAKSEAGTQGSFQERRKWLFRIVFALIVIVSIFILPLLFITAFGESEILNYLRYGFLLSLSIGLNFITIKSFNYPEVVLSFPQIKYGDTALSADLIQSIQSRLNSLMTEKQPYLDSELKLDSLASMLSIRPVQLSQAINAQYGKNFSEYINEYRVNEAKRILREDFDEHHSMYEVALDSGFNSKATFNRVFKQMTGSTPTSFVKSSD